MGSASRSLAGILSHFLVRSTALDPRLCPVGGSARRHVRFRASERLEKILRRWTRLAIWLATRKLLPATFDGQPVSVLTLLPLRVAASPPNAQGGWPSSLGFDDIGRLVNARSRQPLAGPARVLSILTASGGWTAPIVLSDRQEQLEGCPNHDQDGFARDREIDRRASVPVSRTSGRSRDSE